MDALRLIAEERIREAMADGEFENLPGAGRPLADDYNPLMPSDLRMGYKILKNAGCIPPELELRKEIYGLAELLSVCEEGDERVHHMSRLRALLKKLGTIRPMPTQLEERYLGEILGKLVKKKAE